MSYENEDTIQNDGFPASYYGLRAQILMEYAVDAMRDSVAAYEAGLAACAVAREKARAGDIL
jgi:hypothetical protein